MTRADDALVACTSPYAGTLVLAPASVRTVEFERKSSNCDHEPTGGRRRHRTPGDGGRARGRGRGRERRRRRPRGRLRGARHRARDGQHRRWLLRLGLARRGRPGGDRRQRRDAGPDPARRAVRHRRPRGPDVVRRRRDHARRARLGRHPRHRPGAGAGPRHVGAAAVGAGDRAGGDGGPGRVPAQPRRGPLPEAGRRQPVRRGPGGPRPAHPGRRHPPRRRGAGAQPGAGRRARRPGPRGPLPLRAGRGRPGAGQPRWRPGVGW